MLEIIAPNKQVVTDTHTAEIYMAGDIRHAKAVCRRFCDKAGLCVNLSACDYIYTGGQEAGFRVGLINYPRFPCTIEALYIKAQALADQLRIELDQESYSIVTSIETVWRSWRAQDLEESA